MGGRVPSSLIFTPWKMTKEEQQKYGVLVGADYPTPIGTPTGVEQKSDGGNKAVDKKGPSGSKEDSKGGRSSGNYHSRYQRQEMKSLKKGTFKFFLNSRQTKAYLHRL